MGNEKISYEDFFGEMERYLGKRKNCRFSEKIDIYLNEEKMSVKVECKHSYPIYGNGNDVWHMPRFAKAILISEITADFLDSLSVQIQSGVGANSCQTALHEKNVISIEKSGNKYTLVENEGGQENTFMFDLKPLI